MNALPDEINITWHIDDVLEKRPDLTPNQCKQVLQAIKKYHDATIGVNWDVIEAHAEMLFPNSEGK